MIEEIREEWKDIQGFEGRYKISNKGRVKALEKVVMKERILKPGNVNGYEAVNLYNEKHGKSRMYIHRLVASAFIENPCGLPYVNHKDENKSRVTSYVDEVFTSESKKSLLTNDDFDWTGAHTIKINKVNTVGMNDYDRNGTSGKSSRYGDLEKLGNEMEDLVLKKDRSFTFAIDKMDKDETQGVLAGASALARQQREVIIPEVDKYTYGVMAANAGTKVVDVTLTAENIYDEIIEGTKALDDNDVPDTGRILTVVPDVYRMMKKNTELNIDCDITAEQRAKGVIAMVDGMDVIKMTAKKMPERAGFMISHPVATVAPTKLEDYKIHQDPPGISGELVEGRIVYDAFVLDNKKMAIYYVENKATE